MEPARKQQQPRPVEQPVDPRRVSEALAEIARDVRVDPKRYLDETKAPGGGE